MDDADQCLLDVIGDPDALTQFLNSTDGPATWDPSALPDSTTPDIPPFDPSLFGGIDDDDEAVGLGVELPASLEDTISSHGFSSGDPTLSSYTTFSHTSSSQQTATLSGTSSSQPSQPSALHTTSDQSVVHIPASSVQTTLVQQQQQQQLQQQPLQVQNQQAPQQILLQQQLLQKLQQQLQPVGTISSLPSASTAKAIQIQAGKIGQPQVQLSTTVSPARVPRSQAISIGSLLPSASQTLANMANGQRAPQNTSQPNQSLTQEAVSGNVLQLKQQQATHRVQQTPAVQQISSVQVSSAVSSAATSALLSTGPVQATIGGKKVIINSIEDLQNLRTDLLNSSQLLQGQGPLQVQLQQVASQAKPQNPGTIHHMPTAAATTGNQVTIANTNSFQGATVLSGATSQASLHQLPQGTVLGLQPQKTVQAPTNVINPSQTNITGLPSGTVLSTQAGIAGLQQAAVITGLAQPAVINVATPQGPQQVIVQKALPGLQGQPGVILRTVGTNLVQLPQAVVTQSSNTQQSSVPQQLVVNLNSINQLQQHQTQITQLQQQQTATSASLPNIQLPAGAQQIVHAASLPQQLQPATSTVAAAAAAASVTHTAVSQSQQPQVINVQGNQIQLQSQELQQKTQVAGNVTLNISGQTVNVQNVHQLQGVNVQNLKGLQGLHVNTAPQGASEDQNAPILPQINVGNVQVKNQQVINNPQVISNPQLINI